MFMPHTTARGQQPGPTVAERSSRVGRCNYKPSPLSRVLASRSPCPPPTPLFVCHQPLANAPMAMNLAGSPTKAVYSLPPSQKCPMTPLQFPRASTAHNSPTVSQSRSMAPINRDCTLPPLLPSLQSASRLPLLRSLMMWPSSPVLPASQIDPILPRRSGSQPSLVTQDLAFTLLIVVADEMMTLHTIHQRLYDRSEFLSVPGTQRNYALLPAFRAMPTTTSLELSQEPRVMRQLADSRPPSLRSSPTKPVAKPKKKRGRPSGRKTNRLSPASHSPVKKARTTRAAQRTPISPHEITNLGARPRVSGKRRPGQAPTPQLQPRAYPYRADVGAVSATLVPVTIFFSPTRHRRRTSTGCWTCRVRKKPCDGAKPVCTGCARLELACDFGEDRPHYMMNAKARKARLDEIKMKTTVAKKHHMQRLARLRRKPPP